ncbi:MAG: carboxypeptidase-like regulatory domain-containing protein [Aureibaculum sp.]|nr:carboxypeptidase-like regulatory domain-containing protein [Aureibaculum sp.]
MFLFFGIVNAQQVKNLEKITLSFKNLNKSEVLKEIEKKSNYYFYFGESWLKDDKLISGDYTDVNLNVILRDLFKDTQINYFIYSDNMIVLTLNSIIHDSFPNLVWKDQKVEEESKEVSTPIFYRENLKKNLVKSNVVRIGKEAKNSTEKSYLLTGYARNINSGEPIPRLAIIVKNKNISAVTNDKGLYSIRLPTGANSVEAKSIGYTDLKKNIIIYNNGVYNFLLSENSELLDELVIEADKDKNIKEAVTGITSIKIQEIKNIPLILGERDILKVATTIPGIKTAGEGSAGFNVRGGKADQNLILLDDAVLYNPQHFFGIFSAINPFTTGGVDIYKGSIPSEFGGRLSSVFNIKTKEADYEKISVEASIGPVTSNVTLQTPIVKGKSSLIVGGRGTYSNWILRSLKDKTLKKSSVSFYDFNLKYSHKISENDKFEASGYYSNDSFSITSDSLHSYTNRLVSLKWRHQFNDKNYGDLIIANSEYKFNIEFDQNSINDFDLDYRINETEVKLRMKYLANEKHKIDYGISSKLFNISPGNINPKGDQSVIIPLKIADERGLESAIFVADNFEVNQKLLLNIGFRYSFFSALGASTQNIYDPTQPRSENSVIDTQTFNKNEVIKTYSGSEIRSSLRYSLSPSLAIKASYNNTYQYIHTLSNNTTASPTDTWRLSNLNIKPQQANQYSLGLYKNIDGNEYELSLEGYYKNSKNILDYKVGANLLLNETIESEILQGEGKAYGVEFLLKKNKGRLNGWLGYSYSRSFIKLDSDFNEEQVNNGRFFPTNFDKPHDVNIIANYKITKRYSFSTNFSYQTGRPVTYPLGSFILNGAERVLYSDRNKFRIPDYYRLDIGFNVEGNHKLIKVGHSFWNISVYNVLGRNNPYSVFFVTESGKIKAYKSSIFSIPIPTITYNITF